MTRVGQHTDTRVKPGSGAPGSGEDNSWSPDLFLNSYDTSYAKKGMCMQNPIMQEWADGQ